MSTTLLDSGDVRVVPAFLPDPNALYDQLVAGVAWDSRMRARKAASFGTPYNYSGIEWPAAPIPELIRPVLDRVAAAVGFEPNNCLAHYYPDGSSTMGYHADAAQELAPGTGIAVVSLGAERAITFRAVRDRGRAEAYPLPNGSLLVMTARMQADWHHAILAVPGAAAGRVSLTFRRLTG